MLAAGFASCGEKTETDTSADTPAAAASDGETETEAETTELEAVSYTHLRAVKTAIADILEGFPIMDALSDFEFYKTGTVTNPIPASDHIEPFLEAGVPGLWTYYCCGQSVDVSNRYIAMPSSRTRVIGMQLWKYNIAGFLQWGYNFWYEIFSLRQINPYLVTDGGMRCV